MCFDGCSALCQRLTRNDPTLTVLNLNHLSMGNDGAKALAAALKHNTTVVVLFIQHNRLGAAGMQALTQALRHHPTLAHLYLDDNHIGEQQHAGNFVKQNTAGCQALAELITNSPSLQVLKVADNHIGPAGARILAQALQRRNHHHHGHGGAGLEYLCLQKNPLGMAGMQSLCLALRTNTTLRWLDLRCSKLDTHTHGLAVVQAWIDVLQHDKNESLCILELWETREKQAMGPALSRAHERLDFWLQWNRAGRRSLKNTTDHLPVPRLLANASSPAVILATLQARPDLLVPRKPR